MENQCRFENCTSCGMKVPTKNKYNGNGFKCRDCREEMKKMKGRFHEKKLSSYVKNPFHEKQEMKQNETPNENIGERRKETCSKCSIEVETLNTYTGSQFMCPTCREDGKRMMNWNKTQDYLQKKLNRKKFEKKSNVSNKFSALVIENDTDTDTEKDVCTIEKNVYVKHDIIIEKNDEEFPSLGGQIVEKKPTTETVMNFSKAIKTVFKDKNVIPKVETFLPKLYQREVSKKNSSFSKIQNIEQNKEKDEEDNEEEYVPKQLLASNSWGNNNFGKVSWGYEDNIPNSWDDE